MYHKKENKVGWKNIFKLTVWLIPFRKELDQSTGQNPGIAAIWEDEKARRRIRSDSSLIELPASTGDRNEKNTNKEEDSLKVWKI